MKFRLDAQHYINDRLLEPGHIIGDETDVPFRTADGSAMKPSVQMTPVDQEALSMWKKEFPNEKPQRDPTAAIPIQGSGDKTKQPAFVKDENTGLVRQPGGQGVVDTLDNQPGSYVIGPDGKPTKELKKGLPDPGSPNHPVGQPVQGHVAPISEQLHPTQATVDAKASNPSATPGGSVAPGAPNANPAATSSSPQNPAAQKKV